MSRHNTLVREGIKYENVGHQCASATATAEAAATVAAILLAGNLATIKGLKTFVYCRPSVGNNLRWSCLLVRPHQLKSDRGSFRLLHRLTAGSNFTSVFTFQFLSLKWFFFSFLWYHSQRKLFVLPPSARRRASCWRSNFRGKLPREARLLRVLHAVL